MGGELNNKKYKILTKIKIFTLMFFIVNLNTIEKFLIKRNKKRNYSKFLYKTHRQIGVLKLYLLQLIIKIVT